MACNTENFTAPKNYTIRPGTVDYGKDYEVKMATLLSLRCAGNKMVQNMWLAMNDADCGAFDDIVLHVQTQNGRTITYLIQLKHRMEPTDIATREFKAKKGDFLLEKYYDTVVQIKSATDKEGAAESEILEHLRRNRDTTLFILFTNRGTTANDFLKVVDKKSAVDNIWLLYQIVDTNGSVFSFDYEKLGFKFEDTYRDCMERLFLFTKQISINQLDAAIEVAIENLVKPLKFQKNVTQEFVQKLVFFVNNWSKGELGGYYPLHKDHILRVLFEHLVATQKAKIEKPKDNFIRHIVWDKILEDKVLTIVESDDVVTEFLKKYISSAIDDYCENSENKNLWKRHPDVVSKQILRIAKRSKDIKFCDAYECLWKNGRIPLLLEINSNQDFNNLLCILNSFQECFRVVVLVKGAVELTNIHSSNKTFCNLRDLKQEYRREILTYPVQLQGRFSIRLLDFVTEDLLHFISVKDVIYILSDKFNVGHTFTDLPEIYIERSLKRVWLKPDVLQKATTDAFVIRTELSSNPKIFFTKQKQLFKNFEITYWDDVQNNIKDLDLRIVAIEDENQWDQIINCDLIKNRPTHYLTLHGENELEWIKSLGTIKNIIGFRINFSMDDLEVITMDKAIANFRDRAILISACPGMGKSILLDYIALCASTDMWVIRVNLLDHVDYYKSEGFEAAHMEPSKHLLYFTNKTCKNQSCQSSLVTVVLENYLNSKKVLVLLDGFDEIPLNCQAKASKMIKSLRDSNYSMCLTTRPILKVHLEELLDTFAVTINPFTRNDQVMFLTKYFAGAGNLCGVKSENVQELIKEFVEKLLGSAKQNLNDRDQEFTGVPLQTKLLAEVFVEECKKFVEMSYFENVHFDLLYLYKHFIEQKVKIVCLRFGNNSDDMLYHYKTYRSFYALRLLFSKEDLKEMNLEERLKQVLMFFPDTLQQLQKDGIVVAERESNVTFVHRSFAEYLAAEWLAENIDSDSHETVKVLIKRTFEPNFITVRNIFDRILAKNCPLHTAIINRQLSVATEIISSNESALTKTDRGNRSFLHMIAAWGVYHPFSVGSEREIKILYQLVAKDVMTQILKMIPHEELTSCEDNLLQHTPLDYAILSGSLNVADAICARLENVNQGISLTDIDINYSFYFKHFPYGSLGSILIKQSIAVELNTTIQKRKLPSSEENELHREIINGNIQKASLLLSMGKNIDQLDFNGFTLLHLAAMFKQTILAHLLVSNGAVTDIEDSSGKTPLHWATAMGELKIVVLLLSTRTNVNMQDNIGMSALHYAIVLNTDNQIEIVSVLLKHGASILTKDNYGKTPLHYALHYNQMKILKLLLDFGANINITSDFPVTTPGHEYLLSDYLLNVLTSRDSDGGTVLHWAADKGLADIVSLFLSHGVPADIEDNDGRTAVHWAAERGHDEVICLLLSHGASINVKDIAGRTPLFLAVNTGNVETVKLLLEKGACVEVKDATNMDALHWAACLGNTDLVNLLLPEEKEKSLEERNSDGSTALISAAKDGHITTVDLLLRRGADIEATDNLNMSALHWASWNGYLGVVEFLLFKGVALEAKDKFERTPLLCAARNGHTLVVAVLLRKGANIDSRDDKGLSALHWVAVSGHVDTVNLLIANGSVKLEMKNGSYDQSENALSSQVDINAKNNNGETALHYAAYKDNVEVLKLLLDRGANLEIKSNFGKTALIYASEEGRTVALELLLRKGADVQTVDRENMSALIWAAHNGHAEAVELLVNYGAKLEAKNIHGSTAVICAALNGHTSVVDLLMSIGVNIEAQCNTGRTALHWAAYNGNIELVNLLLGKGLSINLKDAHGRTPLIHAAHRGHQVLVSLLLFKGADIDTQDNENTTALKWAAEPGHAEVVNLLLSKGANLEIRDNHGETALMSAVTKSHIDVVALLLAKGADMEVADLGENKTALHIAAMMGCRIVTEVLVGVGANLEAKDRCGRTPLIYASTKGDLDTVKFLLSRGADHRVQDKEGQTALDWAKRNGKEIVATFLQQQLN